MAQKLGIIPRQPILSTVDKNYYGVEAEPGILEAYEHIRTRTT